MGTQSFIILSYMCFFNALYWFNCVFVSEYKMMLVLMCFIHLIMAEKNVKEASCFERDSCQSGLEHQSYLRNCGCEPSCVTIGDCCHDYKRPSWLVTLKNVPKVECAPFPMIQVQGAYVYNHATVRTCPAGFKDDDIRKRCESVLEYLPFRPAKIAKDVLFFVPVVGQKSRLL